MEVSVERHHDSPLFPASCQNLRVSCGCEASFARVNSIKILILEELSRRPGKSLVEEEPHQACVSSTVRSSSAAAAYSRNQCRQPSLTQRIGRCRRRWHRGSSSSAPAAPGRSPK